MTVGGGRGDDDGNRGVMRDEKVIERGDAGRMTGMRSEFVENLQEKEVNALGGECFGRLMLMQEGFERLKASDGKVVLVFVEDAAQIARQALHC